MLKTETRPKRSKQLLAGKRGCVVNFLQGNQLRPTASVGKGKEIGSSQQRSTQFSGNLGVHGGCWRVEYRFELEWCMENRFCGVLDRGKCLHGGWG